MKVKLILLLLFSLMIFNCKEEKKIEIIPNLEAEYLSENEVDKPVEYKSDSKGSARGGSEDLIEAIKSIHDSKTKERIRYIIRLRLYITENGKIDKIKDMSSLKDRAEFSADGIRNYTLRDRLNDALATKLAKLQFNPALKDGKNVKTYKDIVNVSIVATPGGKFEIESSNFLSGILGSSDKYFVAVEEMPEPIGGIQAIQKNIRYPELAKLSGIQGKVYIRAFINENGDVIDAQIVKGIGAGCGEAALEAVKMVKFKPGRQNGQPVKTQVTIPILFKLQ